MKSMQKSGPIPVLLTVRELNQGGIERDVGRVATHLDRSRFAPHVASFHAHGMRYQELRTAGIPVFHLAVKSTISLGALWQAWRLFRYLRRHRIQLVHAWDTTAVLVIPVAWLARTPAILSSVLGYRDLIDQRSRQLWRQTDRLVKGIVVNCEAMRRHVIEDEGARVRVELLPKISATDFPVSGRAAYAPLFIRAARAKSAVSSARLKSEIARKSRLGMPDDPARGCSAAGRRR